MDESLRIFVYGTLMRDGSRAGVLTGQRFVGDARTEAAYRLYDCGGYPGLVEAVDGCSIEGELWDVDATCVRRLDQVEAVDEGLYRRVGVRLLQPHQCDQVQTYLYTQPIDRLQDCGSCWVNHPA